MARKANRAISLFLEFRREIVCARQQMPVHCLLEREHSGTHLGLLGVIEEQHNDYEMREIKTKGIRMLY